MTAEGRTELEQSRYEILDTAIAATSGAGSISTHTVNHASCPVTVVRAV